MNIIERGKQFVQYLRELVNRSAWDWRRCPKCGDTLTKKIGGYKRHPWTLEGRQEVRVQRHWCDRCASSYHEESPFLVRGSRYAREVHRFAIDHWQHVGSSLRRTAEIVRSLLGKQERWHNWRLFSVEPEEKQKSRLSHSTVHRWLDKAGIEAKRTVPDQLAEIATSGQVATDGLWARLLKGRKRVVLALVDTVTGLIFPPVVVEGEDNERSWGRVFRRARLSGLELDRLRGVASDGASGLIGYLGRVLGWVNHQRCVFHLWRNLSGELAARVNEAATGLARAAAKAAKKKVREELVALVRGVLDAPSQVEAEAALAQLKAHQLGGQAGGVLGRASGCGDGAPDRIQPGPKEERAQEALPAPGHEPLAVAGAPPGDISYLDALAV